MAYNESDVAPTDAVSEQMAERTKALACGDRIAITQAPAEQREIWRKEGELRMRREGRVMALDRALTLAPQLGGDHQAIVRAARDFLAFLDE